MGGDDLDSFFRIQMVGRDVPSLKADPLPEFNASASFSSGGLLHHRRCSRTMFQKVKKCTMLSTES